VSTQTVFFYLYSMIAVAGAVGLVAAPKLVHAVMSLFATMFAIAALYLLLGSEFLAAMQLFVYGGAITVLVLFVLMLSRPEPERVAHKGVVQWIALAICAGLFGVLATTLGGAEWHLAQAVPHDTASLASILFSRYVLPFELAGLVLTIALIGAIVLAREDDVREPAEELPPTPSGAEVVVTPSALEEAGGEA
jgi:NADH:ubiquinone oxidoreductase subunit 6 (subunit J)